MALTEKGGKTVSVIMRNRSNNSTHTSSSSSSTSSRSRSRNQNRPAPIDVHAEYDTTKQYNNDSSTPQTAASTPLSTTSNTHANANTNVNANANANATPNGFRGQKDIRSPGVKTTPPADSKTTVDVDTECAPPVPSFITQTDQYGRATSPRTPDGTSQVSNTHTHTHTHTHTNTGSTNTPNSTPVQSQQIKQTDTEDTEDEHMKGKDVDACDTLLESLRMMCCCILPDVSSSNNHNNNNHNNNNSNLAPQDSSSRNSPTTVYPHNTVSTSTGTSPNTNQIKLLDAPMKKDVGKKCLVLDLDETLVHSSFRAVAGADFVIPVQIEDVVHFVYVAKRPGVDKFLAEMAKHYEIVVYTASLNKYADPLLDLLDPKGHIRYRLFRESCVYYDGNYVKDMSLINRDLSQSIIVDNSPASYIFHPDNAIDCSSFIDDPADRELDQIGAFLKGVRDVKDVRKVCGMWREWPLIPKMDGVEFPDNLEEHEYLADARDEQCPR